MSPIATKKTAIDTKWVVRTTDLVEIDTKLVLRATEFVVNTTKFVVRAVKKRDIFREK
jgi:hypothetical protein